MNITIIKARIGVCALALNYGIGITVAVITVSLSALAARSIGMEGFMTTVPYGTQFLIQLLSTLPSALLISRFGRKPVFLVAAFSGICGGVTGAIALSSANPYLFTLAHALLGFTLSSVALYRFAAFDMSDTAFRPSAISMVILGGIFAAVVGPFLARGSSIILPGTVFSAAYLSISIIAVLIFGVLMLLRIPTPQQSKASFIGGLRDGLGAMRRDPVLCAAILASAGGFGIMNFLMISASLAMNHIHIDLNNISFAIQYHVLAMFVPSLFMGRLIKRFGGKKIIVLGTMFYMTSCTVAIMFPDRLLGFNASLVLLGLAWNMLYVSGSFMVARLSPRKQSISIQALNEFAIGLVSIAGAFAPGLLVEVFQWHGVNSIALFISGLLLIIFIVLFRTGTVSARAA